MTKRTEAPAGEPDKPGLAWVPLLLALLILVVMAVLPGMATKASGAADHTAAMLIFGAMSAGFVRGVGFVPRNLIGRALLSGETTVILFLLACLRLMQNGRLPAIF
jgi:predicted membrane protein